MVEDAKTPEVEGQEKAKPDTFSREYVEELRRESAKYRTSAKDLTKQVEARDATLKEHEDAGKSEVERLTAENTTLVQSLKDRDTAMVDQAIRIEVERAAAIAGVINPEAAYRLINHDDLEYEDGKVAGVDKALKTLLKNEPYLVRQDAESPPPDPGSGGTPIDSTTSSADEELLGVIMAGRKK